RARTGSRAARGSPAAAERSMRAGGVVRAERSRALAGDPDLLGGPAARPLPIRQARVPMRLAFRRSLDLDQVLEGGTVRAEEADPIAVAEVDLDAARVIPDEPVHPEVGPDQLPSRRKLLVGRADDHHGAVDEQDEPAARPEQASRLGDPAVGVGPDR